MNELINMEALAKFSLMFIEAIINGVEKSERQNEQWFLDYLDELNRLSVIY